MRSIIVIMLISFVGQAELKRKLVENLSPYKLRKKNAKFYEVSFHEKNSIYYAAPTETKCLHKAIQSRQKIEVSYDPMTMTLLSCEKIKESP